MGWYTVTKRIKGKAYLYRQRTWREVGRVRTESQYIGPAGDSAAAVNEFNQERVDAIKTALEKARAKRDAREAPVTVLSEVGTKKILSPKQILSTSLKPVNTTSFPNDPVNTTAYGNGKAKKATKKDVEDPKEKMLKDRMERHGLSHRSLEAEHKRFLKQLSANRIDPVNVPRVVVASGPIAGLISRLNGGYTVSLPLRPMKGRSARIKFRAAYRKALASAYLDAIKYQRPDVYEQLRSRFSDAHWQTKWAMIKYIFTTKTQHTRWVGRGKNRRRITKGHPQWALTLHVLATGQVPDVIAKNKYLTPEQFGLQSFDRKSSWRDEARDLMADVMQRDYQKSLKRYRIQEIITERTLKKAITTRRDMTVVDRMQGKHRQQKLKIKRLIAREQALKANARKLKSMQSMLSEYDPRSKRTKAASVRS